MPFNTASKGAAFLLFVIHYFWRCACRGELHYRSGSYRQLGDDGKGDTPALKALRRCFRTLTAWYFPNPLLSHPLVQSVLAPYARPAATGLNFHRQFVPTPDGGTICLSWASVRNITVNDDAPVLFVLPGTNGDELTSWYIHLVCREAIAVYGYHVVVYVRRGCNLPMTNGRPQDYADPMKPAGDMSLALSIVRARFPRSKLAAVGYSLGGNYLANYLGSRNECEIDCAASVCAAYDVTGLSYWIEHRYKLVDWFLRMNKTQCLRDNRSVIENDVEAMRRGVNIEKIIAAPSFRAQCELDNLLVWGEPGETLNRYLDRSSCANRIEKIKVPTLFLASLDDPVSHDLFIPYEKINSNPNCVLVTTNSGGHHAYVDAFLWGKHVPYCDHLALEWIRTCLSTNE